MFIVFGIATLIMTIAVMEGLSWLMHKYLFHGPLWFIHKTHHLPKHHLFELNDVFSIAFAVIALWLVWLGHFTLDYRLWIGVGISIYGVIYFILHDWFIHNRLKSFKSGNKYLTGIRKAHKIHHKSMEKNSAKEFGLLVVSKKWFKK